MAACLLQGFATQDKLTRISQRLVLSTKDKRNDFLNFNPADTFHLNIRGISISSLPSRDLSRITQFPIKNRRNQFTKRNIQEYSIIINNKLLTSKGMRIERFPFSLLNTGFQSIIGKDQMKTEHL